MTNNNSELHFYFSSPATEELGTKLGGSPVIHHRQDSPQPQQSYNYVYDVQKQGLCDMQLKLGKKLIVQMKVFLIQSIEIRFASKSNEEMEFKRNSQME